MTLTAYCTPQQLIDTFGQVEMERLTDIERPRQGAVVMAVAQRACDRANAEVETSVAARYVTPLNAVPAVLTYIAGDLAHYYLYGTEPPTWVQARFDAARADLKAVRLGTLPLGPDVIFGFPLASPELNVAEFNQGSKVMGRDPITGGVQ
jgi:phage gp36-like protein